MVYRVGPENKFAYRAIIFFAALLLALAFGYLASGHPRALPEVTLEDTLQRIAPAAVRPDVVLVALDTASVQKYGQSAALKRSVLADCLKNIEAGKPKAVILDMALNQRTQTGDADLWRVMADHRNVVLGMAYDANRQPPYTADDVRAWRFLEKFALTSGVTFGPQTQVFPYLDFQPPVSDFTGSAREVGVFDRETDADGVVRSARLFYLSQIENPTPMPTLPASIPASALAMNTPVAIENIALAAAQPIFDLNKTFVVVRAGRAVQVSDTLNPPVIIPVDGQGRMQFRYAGPAGRLPADSMDDVAQGKIKSNTFQDKVVLIGATDPSDPGTDAHRTPFGLMPRVEITANAISSIMSRSYYTLMTVHPRHTHWIVFLVGLVTGLALMFLSGWRAFATTVVLLIAYCLICWYAFTQQHWMLPILPGLLTIIASYLVVVLLLLGPFKPVIVGVSPSYVPPPSDVVH